MLSIKSLFLFGCLSNFNPFHFNMILIYEADVKKFFLNWWQTEKCQCYLFFVLCRMIKYWSRVLIEGLKAILSKIFYKFSYFLFNLDIQLFTVIICWQFQHNKVSQSSNLNHIVRLNISKKTRLVKSTPEFLSNKIIYYLCLLYNIL